MSSTDGRPLVSTQDSGPESNKSGTGCLGCLSQIVGLKIPVVNLLYKLRQ